VIVRCISEISLSLSLWILCIRNVCYYIEGDARREENKETKERGGRRNEAGFKSF